MLIQRRSAPPLPVTLLPGLVSNPDLVREAYVQLRRMHPAFPEGANSLTAWYFLWMAGVGAPYGADPERFAKILQGNGWKLRDSPRAGDVFVVLGERPQGLLIQPRPAERVGLVGKVGDGWFLAADERMEEYRPHRMSVEQVGYYLRYG